jgi:pantoate--beta-alanine ligase
MTEPMPEVVRDARALHARCETWRHGGLRVGLVPTMGALHDGHLSLVQACRQAGAGPVVVSIFVNPLQFAAHEDLGAYPRTFAADLERLAPLGVELVYAPTSEAMYPAGFQSHVDVEGVGQYFEGEHRPSHFRGVTTVVSKLFNAVGPCLASFGKKDYQQWRVIERMALDLDMPVDVRGCPIVREPDGLAMSSRNRYLDGAQRVRAGALYRGLRAAEAAFEAGERDVSALEALARAPVSQAFDAIDYVRLADARLLCPLSGRVAGPAVLLMAARLGNTRLIDNLELGTP